MHSLSFNTGKSLRSPVFFITVFVHQSLGRNSLRLDFVGLENTLHFHLFIVWNNLEFHDIYDFTTMIYHSEPPVSLTVRRFARKFDLLGGAVKVEPSHELVESAGYNGGRMEVSNANIDPEDLSITSTL